MRLAIIRQRYTPFGGAERFVEGALEALLERNVAITLYTREWPKTRLQLIEPHIVDPFFVGRLWRDLGFARAVTREVGRAKLDLVQSHERVLCCDVYRAGDGVHAVWLAERSRRVGALQRLALRLSPWHRYVLATERRLFASPWLQAVICNSAMVRDEIRERFDVPHEKLRVVYNAVDTKVFSPALREHRAALRDKLGIAQDAIVFLLVGSGYERKGVAGRVTLAGPQADPKPHFGAADAFVLPTLYDPFPNAALEAMACGMAVVTSTKSGAAELVMRNGAGFVCPAGDAPLLAQEMRKLLDADTRERMGANARAAVLPLTPEAMTLELVLIYKELLESSARQQKTDSERKLAAHRKAWAEQVAPRAAGAPPAVVAPADAGAAAASPPEAPIDAPSPQAPAAGEGMPRGS
jgi:UDP-glucose:(heptosyl)LPS alpha-1,3-glucosyltransferase